MIPLWCIVVVHKCTNETNSLQEKEGMDVYEYWPGRHLRSRTKASGNEEDEAM